MISAAVGRLRLFNLREFGRHPGRTIMSLTVVAISAALLVAVFGISGSITGSVQKLATSIGGNADLEVSGVTDSGFDQSYQPKVTAVKGVSAAVPLIRTTVGGSSDPVAVIGADASITALHSDLQSSVQPKLASLLTVPNGVLVGSGMGLSRGDPMQLGAGTATVADVITGADANRINSGHFVVAPLPLAQKITGRPGSIDSILVIAKQGADIGAIRSGITDVVAGHAIVAAPTFRTAQASGGVAVLRSLMLISATGALVVAGFLIYNAMSMAVTQRRPVISMLRAIGGRRRVIVRELLIESALLGLVGGLVGSLVGIFIGRLAIGHLPPALVSPVEARTSFILPGYAIPVAIAACIVASVAASALAARQVYKVAPIEALAPVGTSSADEIRPAMRIAVALAGILGMVGAAYFAFSDLGRASVLAIALSGLAEIALCFAVAGVLVRIAASVARFFGSPGALAAATIERAPRRVWATVMTVMIAVSMTVSTTGSNNNAVDSTTDSFASLGTADIYVSSNEAGVFPTSPIIPANVESEVRAIPGVESIIEGQLAYATVGDTRVLIQGGSPGGHSNLFNAASESVRKQVLAGDGIVVSRDIGKSLGVSAGDYLDLATPTGMQHLHVLEVVPFFSALSGSIGMGIAQLRQYFDRPGSTVLEVKTTQQASIAEVRAAIRDKIPDSLYVYTGPEGLKAISAAMNQGTALISAMAWIVALVAAVALLNTLMLSVLERRRELGVLRAMGSSRRFALRAVLAEAAGIGLVGAALGVVFGAVNQYLNSSAITHVVSIDVAYKMSPMIAVFAAGALALSLLGSIPPAVRASRLNIVDAVSVE